MRYSLDLTEAEREALLGSDIDLSDENAYFQKWGEAIQQLGIEIDGDVAREFGKMRNILEQDGNALSNDDGTEDDMEALFNAARSLSEVLSTEFKANAVAENSETPDPQAPIMVFGIDR